MKKPTDATNVGKVVALAGGVGGAKMAYGLYQCLPPGALTVVVNTGDDLDFLGLQVCPDLDTVMYTLAGMVSRTQGWGIENDAFACLTSLERYGEANWFKVGDRDLATHVLRTHLLSTGLSLTDCTRHLTSALGIHADILPMCDQPVRTKVQTAQGELEFQEYFVRRGAQDRVLSLRYAGVEDAVLTAEVRQAMEQAEMIVICPSNPVLSVEPILSVPGMRDLLAAVVVPRVAISPIIGGKAVRGPAATLLRDLGHEASALGVARHYRGLLDGFVLDRQDAALQAQVRELGQRPMIANTVMTTERDKITLAERVLELGEDLIRCRAEPGPSSR